MKGFYFKKSKNTYAKHDSLINREEIEKEKEKENNLMKALSNDFDNISKQKNKGLIILIYLNIG